MGGVRREQQNQGDGWEKMTRNTGDNIANEDCTLFNKGKNKRRD